MAVNNGLLTTGQAVPVNMSATAVPWATKLPQGHRFCRKEAACWNIWLMAATLPTAHPDRSLLNSPTATNIREVSVTEATFHPDKSEANENAPAN